MAHPLECRLFVACVACLPPLLAAGPAGAQETPPYQIVLRSRQGEVVPHKERDGRTGGGSIQVVQPDLRTVVVLMRGAVVAGAERERGGAAWMEFVLHQDFEVVATRPGLRPPRLSLAGLVTGTLQSVGKAGGNAEQGPACASVNLADHRILEFCIKPHGVGCGQCLFVNDREGPFEATVAPGGYCLQQTFSLRAVQPWDWCNHLGSAVGAIFDPDPRLEARWATVLRPFRGVPHRPFGFGVVLRVVEEPWTTAPANKPPADGSQTIPPPRRLPPEKGAALR
jgi:hypothetical protein